VFGNRDFWENIRFSSHSGGGIPFGFFRRRPLRDKKEVLGFWVRPQEPRNRGDSRSKGYDCTQKPNRRERDARDGFSGVNNQQGRLPKKGQRKQGVLKIIALTWRPDGPKNRFSCVVGSPLEGGTAPSSLIIGSHNRYNQ
jgi:hypothetical protein